MMDVIEATLCGKVNRELVRYFGSAGLSVVGLAGTDQQTLLCTQQSQSLGLVGSIQAVNGAWLEEVLAMPSSPIPVIAPVGVGSAGQCFNVNADWAAAQIAIAMNVDQLLYVTDQTGIMDEEGDIIAKVDVDGLENMIECKVVSGGMLTKVRTVLHALKSGIPSVSIMTATDALHSCPHGQRGTVCAQNALVAAPEAANVGKEFAHVAI
jgi:acetylglutamate kinase